MGTYLYGRTLFGEHIFFEGIYIGLRKYSFVFGDVYLFIGLREYICLKKYIFV